MKFWRWGHRPSTGKSAAAADQGRNQEVLIICHSADIEGLAVTENLCAGLDFAKIRFAMLDVSRGMAWPALDTFRSIIICTEKIWDLATEKTSNLEQFVRSGGGLVVAYRCWHEELSRVFGGRRTGLEPAMNESNGLIFDKELFPGVSGLRIANSDWFLDHSRFDIEFDDLSPESTVVVRDLSGSPIAWSRDLGDGKVFYWNTGVMLCRALRGYLIHSVLDTMGVGVAAVGGFAMFQIDDFPTSLSNTLAEPVVTEFPGLDWNGFFFGVWHEDMMALRAKHGLTYTWYAIMNYGDVDNRPDADPLLPGAAGGQEILAARFRMIKESAVEDEYGFHGYNHDPMIAESWPDLPVLRSKLTIARELWQSTVPGPLPTSWVPANNWYHAEHIRILREVFPEISAVCGLFSTGEHELGEYREFGPDPWHAAMLCLPRETYGYVQMPELRMMMLSQIAGMGVWTHFVHPDDIYDIPTSPEDTSYRRNPETLSWRSPKDGGQPGLHAQLDTWISQVRTAFPWLEFVTTSQAEARYLAHMGNQVDVRISDATVEISSGAGGMYYVKTRQGLSLDADADGALVGRHEVEGGILHVVRCSAGRTVFGLKSG